MQDLLEYRTPVGNPSALAQRGTAGGKTPNVEEASAHSVHNIPQRKEVLIVDDITMTAGLTQVMLSHHGISSAVVYGGEEALDWLQRHRTGVMLCDISMPGMNGIALAKQVYERWQEQRPKLIAYTAYPRDHERMALLQAGFDDFVAKPVRADTLAAIIKKWLD